MSTENELTLDEWLKNCEHEKHRVCRIDGKHNVQIYQLQNRYQSNGADFFTKPFFLIWQDDVNVWTSQNLYTTYKHYNKLLKELGYEV